jgi:hypothetical protein
MRVESPSTPDSSLSAGSQRGKSRLLRRELTTVLEQIARILTGAILPLFFATCLVGAIETLLAFVGHPLTFRGLKILRASHIPGGLSLPKGIGSQRGEVGHLQYLISGEHELLFAGKPSLVRDEYFLKARAVDQGGITLLEVWAPLSVFVAFSCLSTVFLGFAMSALITDGWVASAVFLSVGASLVGVLWWRISLRESCSTSTMRKVEARRRPDQRVQTPPGHRVLP